MLQRNKAKEERERKIDWMNRRDIENVKETYTGSTKWCDVNRDKIEQDWKRENEKERRRKDKKKKWKSYFLF